jgi:hypothetical protein
MTARKRNSTGPALQRRVFLVMNQKLMYLTCASEKLILKCKMVETETGSETEKLKLKLNLLR